MAHEWKWCFVVLRYPFNIVYFFLCISVSGDSVIWMVRNFLSLIISCRLWVAGYHLKTVCYVISPIKSSSVLLVLYLKQTLMTCCTSSKRFFSLWAEFSAGLWTLMRTILENLPIELVAFQMCNRYQLLCRSSLYSMRKFASHFLVHCMLASQINEKSGLLNAALNKWNHLCSFC